jgi:hypothetical protein
MMVSHAYLLSKYLQFRTRICRPIGLTSDDCQRVCNYAVERIELQYDLKNLVDLARYLLPLPFPRRWRRRMIALGSGDPTRLICSALIAQAFGYVGYPISNISLACAARDVSHPRLFAVCSTRLRHLSLFCRDQANHRNRL